MRIKRMLATALILCMVLSCFTPAAMASGRASHSTHVQNNKTETAATTGNLLLSEEDLANGHGFKHHEIGSYRNRNESDAQNQQSTPGNGDWIFHRTDKASSGTFSAPELPSSIQALREAAEIYSQDELVAAFVVLEDEPQVAAQSISQDVTARLERQQENLVETIEREVLHGGDLEVKLQVTTLANAISIRTEFGNLERIAMLDGVKSVFLMPVYQPMTVDTQLPVIAPHTASAGEMSGVPTVWKNLGFTGSGMTIAVIDTGLDLDHPSFAAAPANPSMDAEDIAGVLEDLNASAYMPGVRATELYRTQKIPYAFNYVDASLIADHTRDGQGDHGTHVAGIAAANRLEGVDVVGMAPDAQLVIMKVFGANGGAFMDDIVAALEDAMTLGVDVVNLSLGTSGGFSRDAQDFINEVYDNITNTDIIVNISAGNDGTSANGNMWGTDMNTTENMDNATVSSPSTYANVSSIASVDNALLESAAITLDGETYYAYNDAVELTVAFRDLAGQELEYVMVGGYGEPGDYVGLDLTGKIAVVPRGVTNFGVKLANAEAAGAIGLIITNNEPGSIATFGMSVAGDDGNLTPGVSDTVPAILVSMATGEALAAAAEAGKAVLNVAEENKMVLNEGGGQLSAFSGWGVTPDLRLQPDLAGVGGNVNSTLDRGSYGIMSGTSMASPQVSGVAALVVEYLKEDLGIAEADLRVMLNGLLMSTATPTVSTTSGVEASPRQQGAGLANALNAITAEAYLTVDGGRPKAELGHDPLRTGEYTFSFTVHNFSDAAKTYGLSASLLTEAVEDYGGGLYFMAGYDVALTGAVTFDKETVTVPAGGTADVTVTVRLSEGDKTYLDTYFVNGGYVEGFVYLTAEDQVTLSLPYMGFYGDWTEAPLFDSAYWYENGAWGYPSADGLPDGNQYHHILFTSLMGSNNWMLGFNPYVGAELVDDNGNVIYDPANNVISNNGDGLVDNISEMYISLMRNAKTLTFTYADDSGKVYFEDTIVNVSKTMYSPAYRQIIPYVYSWNSMAYDFTDENGKPLPSGTKLTLTITGELDYQGQYTQQSMVIPITLDTHAPELVRAQSTTSRDGKNYITLTLSEETVPAYAAVVNSTGTQTYDQTTEFVKDQETGYYQTTLEVTGRGNQLTVMLSDYGVNEGMYQLSYVGENDPAVDYDALYGYRVFEQTIYDDSVYGWATIGKTTGETTMLTSDINEYYALTAAEYVGGYVFAVDAGDNLLVMEPGLWDRKTICNLGTGVLDMTFDKTTDTMYLSTKGEDQYGYEVFTISTVDLLTGELTTLKQSGSNMELPYAMAATDDGEIYAVKYYNRYLYRLNKTTWELEYVKDAEGNNIEFVRSDGYTATPYYSQSMTYSSADDVIYWAFFTYTDNAELFTIDVSGEYPTYTSVPFPVNTEFVGLLTLDEDDYTLPEADKLTSLTISTESMTLTEGATGQLATSTLPWNYVLTEPVVWTSSDETVATVDANGLVTGLAAGTATITATCEELTTTCQVTVVHIGGNVFAYNYYNGTGDFYNWINIDMATMTYESLGVSSIDFMIAEYNGHDDCYYGFDEGGSFYRVGRTNGRVQKLGGRYLPLGDMAYDYSSGKMYATSVNQNASSTTLSYVNLSNGALETIETVYDIYLTLACGPNGELYAINADGLLYRLDLVVNQWGTFVEPAYILNTGISGLVMAQSMGYDFHNNVLIWANPETSAMYWIDPVKGCTVKLGDPTRSGALQFFGVHTIPGDLGELPYIPVTGITVNEDMVLAVDSSKMASVSVEPYNATNQDVIWSSSDANVASVSDNGTVRGIAEGTATITATLTDGDNTFTDSFEVSVKVSSENIFGFIGHDIASGSGQAWAEISAVDPTNDTLPIVASGYMIYAEEYFDGKLYAYGYDPMDMGANFHFMTINPNTFEVISAVDMGDNFPFVYDMTYDYASGTMYAVAGYNDDSSDLYMVNMETGELILLMETDPFFMSVAAYNGQLYAMSASTDFVDSQLYAIDVVARTYESILNTGVGSNILASMAFDHDTGSLYWTGMRNGTSGGLYIIDVEERAIRNLGPIGSAGSQVTGLYIMADNFPEASTELYNVVIIPSSTTMNLGDTMSLEAVAQPYSIEIDPVWASSNAEVVTVDENGALTAVGGGTATITATVTAGEKTLTASCGITVYTPDYSFISYNMTDGGFANINRQNTGLVDNMTAGEEVAVRSMAMVDGVIYGYDVNNNFFSTTYESGYARTAIGVGNVELPENIVGEGYSETYYHEVRDLVWDGERMLAVVCISALVSYDMGGGYFWEYTAETADGCGIYQVDMSTGGLTKLSTVKWPDGTNAQNIYAMTAANGTYYVYNSFNDYFSSIDVETGLTTHISTLQNQGLLGAAEGQPMAMDYDTLTGNIYLLFTSNGNFYRMVSFNPSNGRTELVGDVGQVESGNGDAFAGLILNYEHFNHSMTELRNAKAATCTEDGYTGDTYCLICGEPMAEGEVIPALGHDWSDWTVTREVSCTVDGQEQRTCGTCGETETRPIQAPGHEWGEWIIIREATCTEVGEKTRTCGVCNSTETRDIRVTDHEYEPVVTAPTCEEFGYTTWICTACNHSYVTDYVPATGHTFGEWVVTTEPSCTAAGEETRTCTCGETETREVSAFCPAETFTDVDTAQWYHEGVCYVLRSGLMQGRSDTAFAPTASLTRAELVMVLYRMAGEPSVEDLARHPFTDVAEGTWYADAITWAYNAEVVKGMSETVFAPNANVTREQIATVLFRFSGAEAVEENALDNFSDADQVNSYAVEAMNWAVATGLIHGMGDGILNSQGNATRAQVALVLMRYCEEA